MTCARICSISTRQLTTALWSEKVNDLPRYLRTHEAAVYCRLSPRTLEKLRLTGGGPRFIRPVGHRFIRYSREDLDSWLRAGLRTSGSDTADGASV